MKKVINIQGLDCANCAAELERKIARLDGVKSANLVFVTQKLTVEYTSAHVLDKIIQTINDFEEAKVVEEESLEMPNEYKNTWIRIIISAVCFLFGVGTTSLEGTLLTVIGYVLYAIAYVCVGFPVLKATFKNLKKGKIFDENFLMVVASLGAIVIGEASEAVLVMLLYEIGETLQGIAVRSSRNSVAKLMELKSDSATLLKDGAQVIVSPESLQVGDIIIIKAGDKVPVDGILLNGAAVLDTKSLTGESEYKQIAQGEEILSGCINVGGMYEMKVTRTYENSAVQKILDLVENASASKAKPEKFITKFAQYYTPIVCCLALGIFLIVPIIDGWIAKDAFLFYNAARWGKTALNFLVISCPCALIISVPLTYFSGVGACAKNGILVKGATYLDVVAKTKTVAFDKTGTLTEGNFTVCEVYPNDGVEKEYLLQVATALEKGSAHPLAKAFFDLQTPFEANNIQEYAGQGVVGEIDGEKAAAGTELLLRKYSVRVTPIKTAYTAIYVMKAGKYLGAIALGDKVREDAKATITALRNCGVKKVAMLTGDGYERAYKVANEIGVYEVNAQLLPTEKLRIAEEMKQSGVLLYVGDGINDAPVMVAADCAVSMGKLGSAAAVEASDLVLISDNLSVLPKAIKIAIKTRRIVMQNIVFSISMKTVFMILGLCGILPLGLAVFADVGVMLLAVLNSFRVKIIKKGRK